MKTITCNLIDDLQTLHQFKNQWENLSAQVNDSSLCTTWLWLSTWSACYLDRKDKLFIHAYYDNQQLIGITPLYLKKITIGYELRFIGTGELEKHEVCSEFQDFMIIKSYQNEVFHILSQQIAKHIKILAVTLNNTLSTSFAQKWWLEFSSPRFIKKKSLPSQRYILPIKKTSQEQIKKFKSKNIQRHIKKYIALSTCDVKVLNTTHDFEKYYQELISLHNKAWEKRGKNGCFKQDKFVEFHRALAKNLLEQDRLVLFKLLNNTVCIAVFYGIIDSNTLYYYQSGISIQNELSSVGAAMHFEAINIARVRKLKFYDLMQGTNISYKNRYTEGQHEILTLFLKHPSYSVLQYLNQLIHQFIKRFVRLFKKKKNNS